MDVREPIRDAAEVAEMADRAREVGRMALDFEFLWERTYAPVPCLAQVNVAGDVYLVDPIEGAPLHPIAELVSDADVTVVMHAPSADLTLLALATEVTPRSLLDVQTTAGFVGLGAGQGLAALLDGCCTCTSTRASATPTGAAGPSLPPRTSMPPPTSPTCSSWPTNSTAAPTRWAARRGWSKSTPVASGPTRGSSPSRAGLAQGEGSGAPQRARPRAVLVELAAWRERRRAAPTGHIVDPPGSHAGGTGAPAPVHPQGPRIRTRGARPHPRSRGRRGARRHPGRR